MRDVDWITQLGVVGRLNMNDPKTDAYDPTTQPYDEPLRHEPKTTLTDGSPVPDDGSHRELKENGQQKGYVVLSEEERAKGFVRPVRRSYVHLKCNSTTTMGQSIAETYARDPKFYSGTFCTTCGDHFPVGPGGEFVWLDAPDEKVGT